MSSGYPCSSTENHDHNLMMQQYAVHLACLCADLHCAFVSCPPTIQLARQHSHSTSRRAVGVDEERAPWVGVLTPTDASLASAQDAAAIHAATAAAVSVPSVGRRMPAQPRAASGKKAARPASGTNGRVAAAGAQGTTGAAAASTRTSSMFELQQSWTQLHGGEPAAPAAAGPARPVASPLGMPLQQLLRGGQGSRAGARAASAGASQSSPVRHSSVPRAARNSSAAARSRVSDDTTSSMCGRPAAVGHEHRRWPSSDCMRTAFC